MKLTTKRTCEITLVLNESEAKILRGMMQNPIGYGDPTQDEPFDITQVRQELFQELNESLGGYNPAG